MKIEMFSSNVYMQVLRFYFVLLRKKEEIN